MKKIVVTLAALALGLAGAGPAAGAPDGVGSHCGKYICVMTAHHNRFVQDITVRTRDGLPGTLRSYWGGFHSSKVNAASHRWEVGYEQANAKLVCGGLDRDGRSIEDGVCVGI
ncbi:MULTISPECIES: hypothetical protein [Streptomyces]|uniref:Secreted protein n=1 Tax=Streptomyces griseocarneus TaxID=51201 RepID=A0ABX7RQ39_9ACTN|nr:MULTISPECIES: hypothetical protein [Streptomyces]QSY48833.1 hypothetical protein J3S04_28035 [Streptomyces griseocarneus]